jgi:DNA-binding MarR family transcriptional regulator
LERLITATRENSTQTVHFHAALAARLGLNGTDHKTLDLVCRRGPMTAGQIAQLTGVTTGAVTGIIDRLEKAGMARRTSDPSDRRRVVIEAVPEVAQQKLAPLFESISANLIQLASVYSEEELELICDFIERCSGIVEQEIARLRQDGE